MLDLLAEHGQKAVFFWLGWFAEHYPELVKACRDGGQEIASHGYAHLLSTKLSGPEMFREDIVKAKNILENITGSPVKGFRAPGFCTLNDMPWFFEEIRKAGYLYDSSVFPAARGHGGAVGAPMTPYVIDTASGPLIELPQSVIEFHGRRFSVFGGGYLRLAPEWVIRRGIQHLRRNNRPLIVYLHPREIDPEHPRLPMPAARRFKCYVNLKSTYPKLSMLCRNYKFERIDSWLENFKAE
jgi:polysaccharide deacetylase family protein (PEP-CTERM system associated)